jgi:MFS family permease
MGRKILAVVVALIAAMAIIMVSEMIAVTFAPMFQKDSEFLSGAERQAYINSLPASVFAITLAGYIIASFAGGFIAQKMGRRWSSGPTLSLIVGVFLLVGGIVNFFVLMPGQPLWFAAASLISYIPMALLGYRFAK